METMTQTHTCTHIDNEGVSSAHATHLPSCVPSAWFVSSRSSLGAYSAHRLVLLFIVMSVSINYVLFVRKEKWGKQLLFSLVSCKGTKTRSKTGDDTKQ